VQKAFHPMTIRFFILQAHYRSTLDFSNEALIAAEKGLRRLFVAFDTLHNLQPASKSTIDPGDLEEKCYDALNDDFNSPVAIAHIFDAVRMINSVNDKKDTISKEDLEKVKSIFQTFVVEIFGLQPDSPAQSSGNENIVKDLMGIILDIRKQAKNKKDYATSDHIRNALQSVNIVVKDSKEGASWELKT